MGVENTFPVFSDAANSEFSVSDRAVVITEKARDVVILQFFIEKRFFECHVDLPHPVQRGSGSQRLRVKDNVIIPQPRDYFA